MKKKTYEKPQLEVVTINATDIIATSDTNPFSLDPDLQFEEEEWSTI